MHHFVRVGVVPEPVLPGQDVSGPQVPLLRRRPLLLLRRLRVRLPGAMHMFSEYVYVDPFFFHVVCECD